MMSVVGAEEEKKRFDWECIDFAVYLSWIFLFLFDLKINIQAFNFKTICKNK